jgi:drug/metabolite transporter (DMT)-like permease
MLLATIFLTPFALKDFSKSGKSLKDILIFAQLAFLGAFPAQVLMTWGTQYSLASNASIISLCLPVITAIFAFLLLKETMNKIRWISFVLAIVGVILCSSSDFKNLNFGSKYSLGNILIFFSVAANAYFNTGCKKISERYTPMEMLFFIYIFMVILLTPLVIYYEHDVFARIPSFTKQTWMGMSLLTVFHNFLSMILFFKALKALDAMQVALSNYLISFFGLMIAALWLGERVTGSAIAGGSLVLVSTVIVTLVDYRINQVKTVSNPHSLP